MCSTCEALDPDTYDALDKAEAHNNASALRIKSALDRLQAWFSKDLGGAFSNSEYLLGGCPNELAADIRDARAALAEK